MKSITNRFKNFLHILWWIPLFPAHTLCLLLFRRRYVPRSVLHVSYMVHVPYFTVRLLRSQGMKADYLAINNSPHWDQCDYLFERHRYWFIRAVREWILFWKVIARYEIIHSHFMVMPSNYNWEWFWLKLMKRKLVVHYRGCEIRDFQMIQQDHPDINICQKCDYHRSICTSHHNQIKRNKALKMADLSFVTTPDLLKFAPTAIHLPFFSPYTPLPSSYTKKTNSQVIKIVHATNHPGIEGSQEIEKCMNHLIKKGYAIDYIYLSGVSYECILKELCNADLSIGKMKMGYYANFQIESMSLGVPAISFVREEYHTQDLDESGLILTSLTQLEEDLEHLIINPHLIERKKLLCRLSVQRLHNNSSITKDLRKYYQKITIKSK